MSTILPVPYQSAYIICSFTENDIYAGNAISIISPKTMFAVMKRIPPVSTPAVTFVAQYFAFCDLMSKKPVMPLCRSAESTAIYPNDIKSGSISGSQPFIPFIHIKSALYSIGFSLLCAMPVMASLNTDTALPDGS